MVDSLMFSRVRRISFILLKGCMLLFIKVLRCTSCGQKVFDKALNIFETFEVAMNNSCNKIVKSSDIINEDKVCQMSVQIDSNSPVIGSFSDYQENSTNGHFEMSIDDDEEDILIEDLDLQSVLGKGSYSTVYMAIHVFTRKEMAVKTIDKKNILDMNDVECLQTELAVLKLARSSPFLVGLHGFTQSASKIFFFIEYVSGGDFMNHMQKFETLPEEHARFYIAEVVLALSFLHENGIIYRDLKLDNVLLDHEGHIKLTDYGMSKKGIDTDYKFASTFCGTPNYVAPEMISGLDYRFSVDWWALGVLLFELLAGYSPFRSTDISDLSETDCNLLFEDILQKQIELPNNLSDKSKDLLEKLLEKNPNERLGCHSVSGLDEIYTHPFFEEIDWSLLKTKQIEPPYIPDTPFDSKPLYEWSSDDESNSPQLTDSIEFEGFDFVNDPYSESERIRLETLCGTSE